MKRWITLFLLIVLAFSLVACRSTERQQLQSGTTQPTTTAASGTVATLPPATGQAPPDEAMILAFWKQFSPDLDIKELTVDYYGCFGSNHVGFINGPFTYTEALRDESYGDLEFRYYDGRQLYVYRGGEIMPLKAAVDAEWFTQQELQKLHSIHRLRNFGLYQDEAEPPADLLLAMKTAYLQKDTKDPISVDQLKVVYYGNYGGNHVVFFHCSCMYNQALRQEVYGGFVFRYSSGQQMYVYREGELRTMKEAVDAGWFNKESLERLYLAYYQKHSFLYEHIEGEKS